MPTRKESLCKEWHEKGGQKLDCFGCVLVQMEGLLLSITVYLNSCRSNSTVLDVKPKCKLERNLRSMPRKEMMLMRLFHVKKPHH